MNQDFLDFIESNDRYLLVGHERPDGDCLGSQIALYHLLRTLGKEVTICNPDAPAASYSQVADSAPVRSFHADRTLPEFDAIVMLDCAHLSRLGHRMAAAIPADAKIAVIDHHVGSERGDGAVCYVDAEAPATGILVKRLFHHFGVSIEKPAAEAIFLSIVSDTGWFRYSNTTPEVFQTAVELTDAGVDASSIYDSLHRRNHPESVSFLGESVSRSAIELDGRFGYVLLDRAAVDKASRIGFDLDAVMEPLRSVDGMQVVAMFKENLRGQVKLSLRSSHDIDVQAIATSFGGGGHRKAAGASLKSTLPSALDAVRKEVAAALESAEGGG